jgi:hypothetical protein
MYSAQRFAAWATSPDGYAPPLSSRLQIGSRLSSRRFALRARTRILADEVARLYRDGLSFSEIGRTLGVSRERVRQLAEPQGIRIRLDQEERRIRGAFLAERFGVHRVAERLQIRPVTLQKWCRETGIKPKPRASTLDRHPWQEIQSRYLAGESPYALGAAYGLHPQTVSARLRRMNTPMRGRTAAQAARSDRGGGS